MFNDSDHVLSIAVDEPLVPSSECNPICRALKNPFKTPKTEAYLRLSNKFTLGTEYGLSLLRHHLDYACYLTHQIVTAVQYLGIDWHYHRDPVRRAGCSAEEKVAD